MSKKYIYKLAVRIENVKEAVVVVLVDSKLPTNAVADTVMNDECLYQRIIKEAHFQYQVRHMKRAIDSIEILEVVECVFTHSRFITDGFYRALHWFNSAIETYTNPLSSEKECEKLMRDSHIETWFRIGLNYYFPKETDYSGLYISNMTENVSKITYAQKVMNVIVRALEITSLEKYHAAYKFFFKKLETSGAEKDYIIRMSDILGIRFIGEPKLFLHRPELESLNPKERLFFYANFLISELRYIMLGILRPIYKKSGDIDYQYGFHGDISNLLLKTIHRLAIEKKKEELESLPLDYTLFNIRERKEELVESADKETILQFMCGDSKRAKEKASRLLKEVDEHYFITKTPNFKKRKLAAIVFVMWCGNHVFRPSLSFESFKKNICAYYGHSNPSMKPNKIVDDALFEYNQNRWIFNEFEVNHLKIEQYAENK